MRLIIHIAGALAIVAAVGPLFAGQPPLRYERLWPASSEAWEWGIPQCLHVDAEEYLYVCDTLTRQVLKLNNAGRLVGKFPDIQLPARPIDFDTKPDGRLLMATEDGLLFQFNAEGAFEGFFDVPFRAGVANATLGGVTAAGDGSFYVVDFSNHRVYRFASDWTLIDTLGNLQGAATGQFDGPREADIDDDQNLYVLDSGNHRVQVFDDTGAFLRAFGSLGQGDGEFDGPIDFAVFGNEVHVVDGGNQRVQVFDLGGQFLRVRPLPIESALPETGQVFRAYLEFNPLGRQYVIDDFFNRVRRIGAGDSVLREWTQGGTRLGELSGPNGIGLDALGNVWVSDGINNRLQKFNTDGVFLETFGSAGTGNGEFNEPGDLVINAAGEIFVTDVRGGRIQKFDADGNFLAEFGSGIVSFPFGIGLGPGSRVYVGDLFDSQVEVFDEAGAYQGSIFNFFGSQPFDVDTDSAGFIYVTDFSDESINKLSQTGEFLFLFGTDRLEDPGGIHVDDDDVIWVASGPRGVFRYDTSGTFLDQPIQQGVLPGQLSLPNQLAVASDDRVYITQFFKDRVQRFAPDLTPSNAKAIVVAGGGAYPGNALWDATRQNANYAYKALVQQGFTKESIFYLSEETSLDLDKNGAADDVDSSATGANLASAITGAFAANTDNLVLYLVDHGGEDRFRMQGDETIEATELAAWVDQWQAAQPGSTLTIVYDACQSGSFLDELTNAGFDRVVIASAASDESAYFVSQGMLSFSNSFWTNVFNGQSVEESFSLADQAIRDAFSTQNPQIDADGDGIPNQPADLAAVSSLFIGNGTDSFGDAPTIGAVTPLTQTINNTSTATITATSVTDPEGIARVWGVVLPPGYNPGSPDNPVSDLPTFDLMRIGSSDDFAGSWGGFSDLGTYQVGVHAQDNAGSSALPKLAQVTVGSPLPRRAIVVAAGDTGDVGFDGFSAMAQFAFDALVQQGYGPDGLDCSDSSCDDIRYFTAAGLPGFDLAPTVDDIRVAITVWGVDNVQDLTLYIVGAPDGGDIRISDTESLTAADLGLWLGQAESTLPGRLTVIIDSDNAGAFIQSLTPGSRRITVASAGNGQQARFFGNGTVSFSKFFWSQTLNGATVRQAHALASAGVRFSGAAQLPEIDDNGNGVPNELLDGLAASRYAIGSGVLLAGDDPFVGGLSVSSPLTRRFESIVASGITTTGRVDRVIAIISTPGGAVIERDLSGDGGTFVDSNSPALCGDAGSYQVAVYAIDTEGATSIPQSVTVSRDQACQPFLFYDGFD